MPSKIVIILFVLCLFYYIYRIVINFKDNFKDNIKKITKQNKHPKNKKHKSKQQL